MRYTEIRVEDLRKGDIWGLIYEVRMIRRNKELGFINVYSHQIGNAGNVVAKHRRAFYPGETVLVSEA